MATVGRNRAVAEFSSMKMAGFFAWLMWLIVHLRSILGIRNKTVVLFNWIWNYFSYAQSLRLIVYARKAKEVIDRQARLAVSTLGPRPASEGIDAEEHTPAAPSSPTPTTQAPQA